MDDKLRDLLIGLVSDMEAKALGLDYPSVTEANWLMETGYIRGVLKVAAEVGSSLYGDDIDTTHLREMIMSVADIVHVSCEKKST